MLSAYTKKILAFFFFILICGIGVLSITSTYNILNHTIDEPLHIACGMEWLERGTYTSDEMHPPLARIAAAFGLFLDGIRPTNESGRWERGNEILYARGNYFRNLTLARLGILPFFLLATIVVYGWSLRLFGLKEACVATVLFSTMPIVLAHSGLATADAAIMATLAAAICSLSFWLEKPSMTRSLFLGFTAALAILSKMSAIVFLPSCALGILVVRFFANRAADRQKIPQTRSYLTRFSLVVVVLFLTVWGGYRFSIGSIAEENKPSYKPIDRVFSDKGRINSLATAIIKAQIFPAPEFARGFGKMLLYNSEKHPGYVLGKTRPEPVWYFFPVALLAKTPISFLILTSVGFIMLFFHRWLKCKEWQPLVPAISAIILLLISIKSNLNYGARHILPIYPFLAILAGFGAITLWHTAHFRLIARAVVILLITWQVSTSALAHPDYIAYFNEFAGPHPENILVDSDLDWGQDLQRLNEMIEALAIDNIAIAYFGNADVHKHIKIPVSELTSYQREKGWIAISLYKLKVTDGFSWLEKYEPVAFAGSSISIYHIPEIDSS